MEERDYLFRFAIGVSIVGHAVLVLIVIAMGR